MTIQYTTGFNPSAASAPAGSVGLNSTPSPEAGPAVGWGVPVRKAATAPEARRISATLNMPTRPMRAALVSSSPMPAVCR